MQQRVKVLKNWVKKLIHIVYNSFPVLLFLLIISVLFFHLDITVHGRGYLEVKNKNMVIEHANGGKVNNLYVREGDKVKEGQLLAVIDNSYITEDYNKSKTNLDSLRMKEQRLLAEINQNNFTLPANMDAILFEQEHSEYMSRLNLLKKSLDIAESTEQQKVSMLEQLHTQTDGLLKEREIGRKQVSIVKSLVGSGAVSPSNFLSAQSELQKTENMMSNIRAQQDTLNIEIEQAKLNKLKIKADFKSKSQEELLKVQDSINEGVAKETAVSTRQGQAKILSPVDGTIQHLAKANAGSVIAPGGEILTILPDNVPVVVVVKVKPEERDKLWQGMNSRIKVNSFGNNNNEILLGKVDVISSDSIEDRDGRYYKVQIEVADSSGLEDIYPGMSVDAYLTVGKRSVFQYIFKPIYSGLSTALNEL